MKVRQIRRCTSASPSAVALAHAASYAGDDALRSECVLHAMQLLIRELEVCVMAVPSPTLVDAPDLSAILRQDLSQLHSSLLPAQYQASKSSECRGWSKLASEVPLLLDPNTRLSLFRKVSGLSSEELENTKKDRVNGVERSHILDWAAAIVSAQLKQGRHNPLAIQVQSNHLQALPCTLADFVSVQQRRRPRARIRRSRYELILLRCCRCIRSG